MSSKVLIVDDSKLARMGVMKVLRELHPDWESVEASNADDAFKLVKQSLPDYVLMDYNMPGKDGIALAAELHELDANMGIAVISANQQLEVIKRARAAGAIFLPKPLTEKALAGFFAMTAEERNRTEK
ncbi:MAG: response regulator transcription factor [Pseudomonadota bacterium]